MAKERQQPGISEVNPPQQTPVTPEVIPDVEIGIGAGNRSKNFSSADPSRHEKLPGKDEPAGQEERLPGAEETLH